MASGRFLKIGEFAGLCRTTKDTLLHYDRKGLLSPGHRGENGYREYGAEQYFDFDVISLLKEAGCTLEQIRRARESCADGGFMAFLREQVGILRREQRRLEHRISMLSRLVDMAEEASSATFDTVFLEERTAERVLYYPVAADRMLRREEVAVCYSECALDGIRHDNTIDFPFGSVIPAEHARRNEFLPCYLFRRTFGDEEGDIREIPAGLCARMFHCGDIDSHHTAFLAMMKELRARHLSLLSDVHAFDQMSYVLGGGVCDNNYVARYEVSVG